MTQRSGRPTGARSFSQIYGVDFSGAKLAGRAAWIARAEISKGRLVLQELNSLEKLCGCAERDTALAHLVSLVRQSDDALWAMDFPFGLPTAVMDPRASWSSLMRSVGRWQQGAYEFGLLCLARGRKIGTPHVYRPTDRENRTPFDCYHYRIIYQTFHGMRDVLLPLMRDPATAILPFQYGKLEAARRVAVETCPSSTLKRLGLPHHTYKQPAGGPLAAARRRTRHRILQGIEPWIHLEPHHRRKIMRDGGGDALDAVLATVGGWTAWRTADHEGIAKDRRTCREGRIFA
jgi:hypothetical protein